MEFDRKVCHADQIPYVNRIKFLNMCIAGLN